MPTTHYRRPGWFTRQVFNRFVYVLTVLGLSVWGSTVLEVAGRKSGRPRRVVVNLLHHDGHRYLVAPRGETEWVRNLRAAGGAGRLIGGRRRDELHAEELADEDKVPVLRAYLARWRAEVGVFFDGVGPESGDAEISAMAGRHPVFRIS